MNVGLMQICTPLSPSLEIFYPVMTKIKYMYTTTRACTPCPKLVVNVTVIMEPILETGVLIRTKSKAFLAFFSSWRLLNQENAHARVCDMENFYAMPMHLFLITGSEYGLVLITMSSAKAQESLCFCAISSGSSCSLTQSFEVDEDLGRKKI